jgi:hypothetical protein
MVLAGIAAAQVVTTSFQNGVDGYKGTFDRRISERFYDEDGSGIASYYLDGFSTDGSPDEQGLIRFDNIIGSEPGQIPSGATILSARLVLTTGTAGNAHSAGPYGVAGLLQPFDSSSTYFTDFDPLGRQRGAWWQDELATRPVGGFSFLTHGTKTDANVTSVVQSWVDGSLENFGFVVQAGMADSITQNANSSDGWEIRTTGYPFAESRPKLEVTYTTAPVQISTFQEGANGYAGTTMAIVNSGINAMVEDTDGTETTEDASTLNQTFLDGVFFTDMEGNTSSPDELALLKFDNVFGTEPGQAPIDVPVAKAWIVITTGDSSTSAHTYGTYSAHTMLRSWDTTSLHSSFGTFGGLQVEDGDVGPALDSPNGFIRGAEVWFDVTGYLEGVRTGATDNGIAIQANGGTADGWQVHTSGSTTLEARPRLVVYSADLSTDEALSN